MLLVSPFDAVAPDSPPTQIYISLLSHQILVPPNPGIQFDALVTSRSPHLTECFGQSGAVMNEVLQMLAPNSVFRSSASSDDQNHRFLKSYVLVGLSPLRCEPSDHILISLPRPCQAATVAYGVTLPVASTIIICMSCYYWLDPVSLKVQGQEQQLQLATVGLHVDPSSSRGKMHAI